MDIDGRHSGRSRRWWTGVFGLPVACAITVGCSGGSPTPEITTYPSPSPSARSSALVGAGCADYAVANPSGPASLESMAEDPVTTAVSHNPMLTTLNSVITGSMNPGVDFVGLLGIGQHTVFAPTDAAFAALSPEKAAALRSDSALLNKVLGYHVVQGQVAPGAVARTHPTIEGSTLTVTRVGENLQVNGASTVVCGGIRTQNATVYLVDTVLMPPN
ncbi:fasciclin domain-containing protein [Williamsia sterculiae]|uniref:Uncaracterized surface protein containing fasciclin (FAS1) repeats n=1 Tax=Williamsia sterculiae TaxID=1344003 RepID=A0A1N7HCA6_9NOCA|nr:fasciclin domain-containing protein [Williamsia sterculiae]SIS22495.1 Uncaracterized surface protein containing fasciclin (FAS1) repeats [Williamsia sterculiae]